jgi:chaperonin cofactor prefoldin
MDNEINSMELGTRLGAIENGIESIKSTLKTIQEENKETKTQLEKRIDNLEGRVNTLENAPARSLQNKFDNIAGAVIKVLVIALFVFILINFPAFIKFIAVFHA